MSYASEKKTPTLSKFTKLPTNSPESIPKQGLSVKTSSL